MVEAVYALRFEANSGTKELALAILREHECGHGERCRMPIGLCWNHWCGFRGGPTGGVVRRQTRERC